MKILLLADQAEPTLWEHLDKRKLEGVELVLSCGDLPASYLSFLTCFTPAPILYIHGNHDDRYASAPPEGCICIEDTIYTYKGIRILGLGCSMRYNKGIYQERSLPMYPLIRRYLRRVDVVYLLLCAACSAISIAVLLSIGQTQLGSNNKASVQLIASLLGLMLAVVFSTADYHALARAWPLHGVVAWGLVLPTLFLHNVNTGLVTIGYDAGGTSNYSWYRVGGMTFQPAELAKISFILTLALHLSQVRGQVNRPKNLLLLFVHIALPAAAIHVQGDDGTALVFLGIGLVMLYAGGLSHWLVAGGLTAGVVGGAALLTLRPGILKGYQFKRILAVLTPDDPALADITYQQNKGAMAIGTGGLTGQGLLSGEHIFVPNAWNDFIFAYLANVLGFLGAAAVLLLLFALCLRVRGPAARPCTPRARGCAAARRSERLPSGPAE